jgi:hypothetical protein
MYSYCGVVFVVILRDVKLKKDVAFTGCHLGCLLKLVVVEEPIGFELVDINNNRIGIKLICCYQEDGVIGKRVLNSVRSEPLMAELIGMDVGAFWVPQYRVA